MSGAGIDEVLETAIADARATFAAALRARDAEAAATVYTASAALLPPASEPITGRGGITAFWRAGLESGITDVEHDVLQVGHRGELAYEIGRYALSVEAEGEGLVDCGTYVLVHELQRDGSWLRAVEMFSPDQAPSPRRRDTKEES